jgi:hypothetical protein
VGDVICSGGNCKVIGNRFAQGHIPVVYLRVANPAEGNHSVRIIHAGCSPGVDVVGIKTLEPPTANASPITIFNQVRYLLVPAGPV